MKTTLPLLLSLLLLAPAALSARTEAVDLTRSFVEGGVDIDRLRVYQVGEIVLIRGRTADPERAAQAEKFARDLGHTRVANLIAIVPAIGDEGIETLARRSLEMSRALAGCRFEIDSRNGIVSISGQVAREIQKGFAVRMLEKIDGVSEVRSALTLRARSFDE